MFAKTSVVVLALAGVLAICLLLLGGRDPWVAAATGPKWRRRLLVLGLQALCALGLSPKAAAGPASHVPAQRRMASAKTQQWQDILRTYAQARAIAAGKRPRPKHGTPEAKAWAAAFERAFNAIETLKRKGLLSNAEAELVKVELRQLKDETRPTVPRPVHATCYLMPSPLEIAKRDMKQRIELLEKVAASGRVHPEVLDLVRHRIQERLQPRVQLDQEGKRLRQRLAGLWHRLKAMGNRRPWPFRVKR